MSLLLPLRHGFTLVECLMVLAVATIVAGVALPSLLGQRLRFARLDGVQALQRVQGEQEKFRAAHGLYTAELSALRGVTVNSAQGRYRLAVSITGPDSYRAEARAVGEQQRDAMCSTLTLEVNQGFATQGPAPACWGR
jgi:prepilin-type N-terminal cleavage/methylation domain-containing protein